MQSKLIINNVELKNHSSFQIGGRAEFFSEPADYQELLEVIDFTNSESLQPVFFGYGTNLLFPDIPDKDKCFISLKKYNDFSLQDKIIKASAGMPLSLLAILGLILNDSAFDFTYLLPGSIGAGLYINARYFDKEMSDIVKKIDYLDLTDLEAGKKNISVERCDYSYKSSLFQKKPWLILSAEFPFTINRKVSHENEEKIRNFLKNETSDITSLFLFYNRFNDIYHSLKSNELTDNRFTKIIRQRETYRHFSYPSAGSVFRNNREFGKPVGQIIDELGLKGKKIGDAMISPHHGNIIINCGNAQAAEVINLIDIMSESVSRVFGIRPEPEITVI